MNNLMDIISQQSKEIERLESKVDSMFIWIALLAVTASTLALILIFKP